MQPSEELLRGLLAAAPDALIAVDRHGHIAYANERVESLLGWQPHELVARPVDALMPGEALAPAGSGSRPLVVSACHKDGRRLSVDVRVGAFEDGGDPMVVAALREGSDPAEVDVEGLVHDFNNLLGVILNYALLVSRRVDDPVVVIDLGGIRGAAERALELVQRLVTAGGAVRGEEDR